MSDRIHLPGLRAALGRRYRIAPELCCTQQADDAVPRTQSIVWDCEDRRAAARIVPPEMWTREENRYDTRRLCDEWGQRVVGH